MFKLKVAMAGAALLLSLSTQAALVNIDWKTEGDNKAVLHEETGLEWLDLTETVGSYNNILSRTQQGGDLFGWRPATEQEVYAMLSAVAGVALSPSSPTYVGTTNSNPAYLDAHNLYAELFGMVKANGTATPEVVKGGYLTASGAYRWGGGFYNVVNTLTYAGIRADQSSGHTVNTNIYNIGVFLVSDGGLTLNGSGNATDEGVQDVSSAPIGVVAALALSVMGWRRRQKFLPK